jgi:DNA repair protein RadD
MPGAELTMQLRPYQQAAVDAVYGYLRDHDDNPCVVIPTAGGKTPVMATICRDAVSQWGGRVLILAHVRELLQQAADKLRAICPEVPFGVYSAGLKRRDTDEPVIIAGVQSVYKRACDLDAFDLVIVDEAHMIPPEGEGMYRQFLKDAEVVNPRLRTIGLTATPYRLKSGMICGPENILNTVCFEVGVRELIRDGYLCPLITKAGVNKADFDRLHLRAGDFMADEVEDLMDDERLVETACDEIVAYASQRKSVLIFASGVKHAHHIQATLQEEHGQKCGFVSGETPSGERDELLARFRGDTSVGLFERAPLKYLVNVNVLTTGFDAPNIDCVAILRPTMSPGLYYQMVGRGFRLHPDKKNCLVLDFGGNVLRHGPVDQVRVQERSSGSSSGEAPAKECPECHALVATGYATCPECGYQFPMRERANHDSRASTESVLSGQVAETVYQVRDAFYSVHTKQGADEDAPKTMRVDYKIGFYQFKSEWICFEHGGWARQRAEAWWRARSNDPLPLTAQQAVDVANAGGVAATQTITVRTVAGEKFDRIVDYELGEKPKPVPVEVYSTTTPDDIPF